MGSQIASKNLYDLLGNDPELDPDREPEPPTKVIDKPVQRTGKRNAGAEGPGSDAPRAAGGGRGGRDQVERRADLTGDRTANNRADRRDDGLRQDRHPDRLREPREHRDIGGGARSSRGGRGGRGGRGRGDYRGTRTARDDRHNHSGIGEHEKQAAHGWGETTGEGEWADEKAGEAIAQAETKDEAGFTPDTDSRDPAFTNGPDATTGEDDVAPAEPEEKTKSYDQYLAEQAEKRLALGGNQDIRKPNEGSKQKFPEGTAYARNPEDEEFFAGSGGKNKRAKERAEKDKVVIEGQYYAPLEQDRGGRGGRGGGRGGFRGERGSRGGDRGEGRGRGGRGRGESRGAFRGGDRGDRGGQRGGNFNASDERNFPALGA